MEFRKTNLDAFTKKYGIKLGYVSIFCKAASYALQDQPVVNAVIEDTVCLIFFIQFCSYYECFSVQSLRNGGLDIHT